MLYDIAFLIFSLFYLPALIFRGKLHGDFRERFADYGEEKKRVLASGREKIWVHAVSVGEVATLRNLIPLLKEKFPHYDIVISTITKTGNDLAKKLFSKDAAIIYFPLDFSAVVKKAIGTVRPKAYIMVETEIWPNFLAEAGRRGVPSILINGRISDRSFGKYKLVRPFLKNILAKIKVFCMQSELDAERIIRLGAPKERVRVTGNMKFDFDIKDSPDGAREMRQFLGLEAGGELLVAGSTHRGEEEAVLSAYKDLSKRFSGLKLLIAPRHVERASEVEELVRRNGFEPIRLSTVNERRTTPVRRSAEREGGNDERRIYVLDRIGYLTDAYSLATLVFVGGSLIKHGGQNPIEPAALGKPVLFGPYMFNFKNIAGALLSDNAAVQVYDEKDLLEKIEGLLSDRDRRSRLAANAKRVVARNRGAAERNILMIKEAIK